MKSTRKIHLLIRISIIPFFIACLPIVFINSFLSFIPALNSLFIDYVNSGTSFFLPFLSYSNIVFHFSTGHLIDIIIIVNIITFIERGGYQYYVKVCLKKNYLEIYSDPFFLEPNGSQEESSPNSDLLISLKGKTNTIINESSVEFDFYMKRRIKTNHFSSKRGYYSSIFKMKQNYLNYLCNSRNKNFQCKKNITVFQKYSTYNLMNYHLPSKNNNLFSNSFENFHQEEGR